MADCLLQGACQFACACDGRADALLKVLQTLAPWASLLATAGLAAWTVRFNSRHTARLKSADIAIKAAELRLAYLRMVGADILKDAHTLSEMQTDKRDEMHSLLNGLESRVLLIASADRAAAVSKKISDLMQSSARDDVVRLRTGICDDLRALLREEEISALEPAKKILT